MLHDRDVARHVVGAADDRVQAERRYRQRDEQAGRGDQGDDRMAHHRRRRPIAQTERPRCRRLARACRRNGIRPFSTRSPSAERTAGRTVSEANIATATTVIVATANEVKVGSPLSSIPAIAAITVRPGDEDRPPRGRRRRGQGRLGRASGPPLLALAAQVEQRVVDADREPDEDDDRGDVGIHRDQLARQRQQADRRQHRREREQQRHQGRDQGAEGEQRGSPA